MVKRKYSQYVRAAGSIARGVRTGYRMYKRARRAYTSITGKSTQGQTKDYAPLTSQHDYRVTYTKRRMPKRKRRRYVKSIRRYRNQQMKSLPSRIFQYVHAIEMTSQANCSAYFGAFMGLYAQDCYDNNLAQAMTNITKGIDADLKGACTHLRLDHSSLRVVLRNTLSTIVDVDVYKVVCIKDIPVDTWLPGSRIESMHTLQKNLMRQAQGMDYEVTDGGTAIATIQQNAGTSSATQAVGDSLWNNPPFLKYWKIVKQFKVHLPAGSTTEFQCRNSRNRVLNVGDFQAENNGGNVSAKKYVTEGYIFNINGRAYRTPETNTYTFVETGVLVEQYVRYNLKVFPGGSPTLVYDGL